MISLQINQITHGKDQANILQYLHGMRLLWLPFLTAFTLSSSNLVLILVKIWFDGSCWNYNSLASDFSVNFCESLLIQGCMSTRPFETFHLYQQGHKLSYLWDYTEAGDLPKIGFLKMEAITVMLVVTLNKIVLLSILSSSEAQLSVANVRNIVAVWNKARRSGES